MAAHRHFVKVMLIAMSLGSCDTGGTACCTGEGELPLHDIFISENTDNMLSYFVEWRTEEPATSRLVVTCGTDYDETYESPDLRTTHSLFVMGLVARSQCEFRLESTTADGVGGTSTAMVDVAGLPDFLPSGFVVEAPDPSRVQPGWTLVNFHNHSQGGQLSVALLDPQGRIRWYVQVGTNRFGTVVHEVAASDDGVLVGVVGDIAPAIYGWDGDIIYTHPLPTSHHDVRRFPDANHLTYATRGRACGGTPNGGGIDRIDMRTGEVVWTWDLCDVYVPDVFVPDWAHINAYAPIPDQNAFLLSMRNQSTVLKVDEATGDVLWRLGAGGDFAMGPGTVFDLQHAATLLPSGNVLLFDNGEASRGYSRGVEIALDETAMTATLAWEWLPPDLSGSWRTGIWGDADRLPNGNTLMNFGQSDPDYRAHVVEVDAEGNLVWHLAYSEVWASYRADRVEPPPLIWSQDDLPTELFPTAP